MKDLIPASPDPVPCSDKASPSNRGIATQQWHSLQKIFARRSWNKSEEQKGTMKETSMTAMSFSRRKALSVLTGAAATAYVADACVGEAWSAGEPSLAKIAQPSGLIFGAAAPSPIGDTAYRQLYLSQTKLITTDNALKIATIAPQPGPKHYESADRLLQFCAENSIAMRGHCLIWNEWVPDWIKTMSAAERRAFFDGYVEEVVGRYAGKLQSFDIVNEPFWPGHNAPGGFRMGPWYDAFGQGYIRRAFERAGTVDRHTPFVLNEAQTERDDELGHAIRDGLLRLVADLKNAGVRLQAVGLESHLQPRYPHDPGRYLEFVHALAANGVDIYLSEFDVSDATFPDDVATRDAMVAETAEKFLRNVLSVPQVKAVITWELSDKYSFYTAAARQKDPATARLPRPLPYDDRMQPKPLWFALARSMQASRRS
jgi:endo-1,4-beta-xylanase